MRKIWANSDAGRHVTIYKCIGLCKWTDGAASYQTSFQAFLLASFALFFPSHPSLRVPRLKRFLNEIPIRPENSRVIHNPGGLFASRLFPPFRSRFIANSRRYRIATHFHCRSISTAQWADYYMNEKILNKHERMDLPLQTFLEAWALCCVFSRNSWFN